MNITEEIEKAHKLLQKGLITKEEFNSIKQKLINNETVKDVKTFTFEVEFCNSCGYINNKGNKKCCRCDLKLSKPLIDSIVINNEDLGSFELLIEVFSENQSVENYKKEESLIEKIRIKYPNNPILLFSKILVKSGYKRSSKNWSGVNAIEQFKSLNKLLSNISSQALSKKYLRLFILHIKHVQIEYNDYFIAISENTSKIINPSRKDLSAPGQISTDFSISMMGAMEIFLDLEKHIDSSIITEKINEERLKGILKCQIFAKIMDQENLYYMLLNDEESDGKVKSDALQIINEVNKSQPEKKKVYKKNSNRSLYVFLIIILAIILYIANNNNLFTGLFDN